ncbi:UDP-glucose 4-epimerase GalE [Corynebacterium suedekumii]|nr:UDP-glucose 4-epimerase GalE [Corynebacterium suedekumii]
MKLLITGGAGYVGSVCATVLLEAGHDVAVIDNFTTGNREAVPAGARLVEGDVADVADEVLADGGFDGVVHFAARSLVGESMVRPEEYWQHNVVTTLRLLDAMRAHGVDNLVFSSTAATYGEPEQVPITERHADRADQPLQGATKLAIDHAITSYAAAHGLGRRACVTSTWPAPTARIGENREIETHLIPLVLQVALGHREKISVFGDDWPTEDGTAVRDYIHVRDLADAHVLALESNTPRTHRIFNLGSGDGYSVAEVIAACREVTGHPIPAENAPRRAGDPATLIASSERAHEELGWRPSRTDLRTIVEDAWAFTSRLGDRAYSARR